MFLRKDAFEDGEYPELSRAVKYFKQTEGGQEKMCKAVEDYAKKYAEDYAKKYAEAYGQKCRQEEREGMIAGMLSSGKTPEEIAAFTGIALKEVTAVEESLCANA